MRINQIIEKKKQLERKKEKKEIQGSLPQSQEQIKTWYDLYSVDKDHVSQAVKNSKNRHKSWKYGYNKQYDLVVISKDGTIGEIYDINGVKIGLPKKPSSVPKGKNKWVSTPIPEELKRFKTTLEWKKMPLEFRSKHVDYITEEWNRRKHGYWFTNNGKPTYVTGHHYMYLQHTKIDVGLPDYREANRVFFIYWEACRADPRCFGMIYLKIRRSGFSYMGSSINVDTATVAKDARLGILSKTGSDAKSLFTGKVVPISANYPFFFKPIQDGMDRPKSELSFRVPAERITKKNMHKVGDDRGVVGLDTSIDWKNTDDNSYDGEKLLYLLHDECYDPNTKILTEDMTFKPIKDISIGDKVIVEGGKIKTVMKVASGETDMYKVKQKWGQDYVVSRNHRLVLDRYKYNKNKLNTREEVIMTPPEYMELSKFAKQHTFSVKSKGLNFEDSESITIPPYLLGLWLGDGSSRDSKIIVNKEKDHEILAYLGRMSQMLNTDFSITKSDSDKAVYFRLKGLRSELRNQGVLGDKHIPKNYMLSSIETRLQLLAGLIDSDGFVDRKKNCVVFGMCRKDLIEQIRVLVHSCGLSCSQMLYDKSNFDTDVYSINISGDLSIIPTIVERKMMTNYKPTYSNRRCGMDVEYIGKGEFYGIQVDGENDDEKKLILEDFTISMNSSKWVKPLNIINNWKVTRTCLRLGSRIIGKCLMGSTCNALSKGGDNFKALYEDSNPMERTKNGQTKSGMYRLFIPMEWNFEGYIDEYGYPVFETPDKPIMGVDGEEIYQGVIEYWNNEAEGLKHDPSSLNEFYRQFPRTESHAFRDESNESIFNLTKIYDQIEWNESQGPHLGVTRGNFEWKDGKPDTEVVWTPDNRNGRFYVAWHPPEGIRNNVKKEGDRFLPGNKHLGAFGCDSYDIAGVVGGGGSKCALHGLTMTNTNDKVPSNKFFLEYIARPDTAEISFEDCLKAMFYYGMPVLAENNKARFLNHLLNRGYRKFSLDRPDKPKAQLSKSEKRIGGIPNTSEDVRQFHASGIGTYIEQYVGHDVMETYRDADQIGDMPFIRTLHDWAKFNISDRTKHDASISTGLAIMATKKDIIKAKKQSDKISLPLSRFDNSGSQSKIITE